MPITTHRHRTLRPQGYLTLSTLFSPSNLPDLFHPGSTLGVCTLQGFVPRSGVVRSFERRNPLDVEMTPTGVFVFCRLQGLAHRAHDAQRSELFTPHTCVCLPGLFLLRGLLLNGAGITVFRTVACEAKLHFDESKAHRARSPPALSRSRLQADASADASGYFTPRTQHFSLETCKPP